MEKLFQYRCSNCNHEFNDLASLTHHVCNVSEDPIEVLCEICGQFHTANCVMCNKLHCASVCVNLTDLENTCPHHEDTCAICGKIHCWKSCQITNESTVPFKIPASRKRAGSAPTSQPSTKRQLTEMYKTKICPKCNQWFSGAGILDYHIQTSHPPEDLHTSSEGSADQVGSGQPKLILSDKILNTIPAYELDIDSERYTDLVKMFETIVPEMEAIIREQISKHRSIKLSTEMQAHFYKIQFDKTTSETFHCAETDPDPIFHAYTHTLTSSSSVSTIIQTIVSKLNESVADFINKGSGWIFDNVVKFQLHIAPFSPLNGSAYKPNDNLLKFTRSDKLLHIDNSDPATKETDGKCFMWACLAHENVCNLNKKYGTHKIRYESKSSTYHKFQDQLNFDGISFPVSVKDFPKFEAQNPNIALTVLGYEQKNPAIQLYNKVKNRAYKNIPRAVKKEIKRAVIESTFPLYMSDRIKKFVDVTPKSHLDPLRDSPLIHVDLLLVIEDAEDGWTGHYSLIRDLGSYLSLNDHKRFPCRNCLNCFTTAFAANEHREFCTQLRLQKTSVPEQTSYKFERYDRMIKAPYRYYADFEAFVKPTAPILHPNLRKDPKTKQVAQHVPCGYSWVCIDWTGTIVRLSTYRTEDENEDVAKRFLKELIEDQEHRKEIIKEIQQQSSKSMRIDPNLKKSLDRLIRIDPEKLDPCYFCKKKFMKPFDRTKSKIVYHHDHFSGEYISLAHDRCNFIATVGYQTPCFIHNLRNYDSHFLISALDPDMNCEIIPSTSEKYLSFSVNKTLRFVDSFSFLSTSLETLVKNMRSNGTEDFKITRQQFQGKGDVDLLFEKGVYPYTHMQSVKNFEETSLPAIEVFYNDLSNEPLEPELYEHAQKVWNSFGIQNMGEWHDLYVQLDVTLLADVMEKTRDLLWDSFNLDLSHYFSLPMVAWDGVCKMGVADLEYMDVTMHCWIEAALRGGVCGVGGIRSAQANNKYLGPDYDPNKPTSFISFLDINNLYGTVMCEALPEKDFKWVTGPEFDKLQQNPEAFMNVIKPDAKTGYFFEVDLIVPPDEHEKLNDYPPAAVKRPVTESELSSYQVEQIDELNIPKSVFKTEKLIADLNPKLNYITHYRNLQTYLKLGLKIIKVHRAMSFTQRAWMKPFITFNTEMRKNAANDFEKDFWKLLNNASFGKCIEQKRKRQSMSIVTSEAQLRKMINKPTYERVIKINDVVAIVVKRRTEVVLDKPVSVGISILDLSKVVMYNFHYDFMFPKYGNKARVLYGDTDSIVYIIQTEDFYQDMVENKELFDMSDYKGILGHLKDETNKKVLGKMKDEFGKGVILKFAAAKPKMWGAHVVSTDDKGNRCYVSKTKAKGINKCAMKNISYDNYAEVLEKNIQTEAYIKSIRSRKHVIHTEESIKKALNGFDTKRVVIDAVNTLAHGHKDLPKIYKSLLQA